MVHCTLLQCHPYCLNVLNLLLKTDTCWTEFCSVHAYLCQQLFKAIWMMCADFQCPTAPVVLGVEMLTLLELLVSHSPSVPLL